MIEQFICIEIMQNNCFFIYQNNSQITNIKFLDLYFFELILYILIENKIKQRM